LCYPEQYPPCYRYPPGDADALASRLCAWLRDGLPPPVDVSPWYASCLGGDWERVLTAPP
ncbi:MAG TPA: DUF3524 domain-containing protein, partial [Gammaproteobacteria bacterium]|nr:DUF3524 domain-containing protein [Gammaproteobacteria bacterium]